MGFICIIALFAFSTGISLPRSSFAGADKSSLDSAVPPGTSVSESYAWSVLPANLPDGRDQHTLVYSEKSSKAILFAGWNGSYLMDDVWSFDPVSGAWNRLYPRGAITGRRSHRAVYDPDSNRVIVFGGFRGTLLNDVWALDLGSLTWRELRPSGTLPPGRSNHALAYDAEKKRLIVFGGLGKTVLHDVWALSLSSLTWEELITSKDAPPPLFDCSAVWDPLKGRVLVFGGNDGTSPRGDIWALTLSTKKWEKLISRGSPSPQARSVHSAILDPVQGKMLLFGGMAASYMNDLWSFDLQTRTWEEISSSPLPARSNSGFVYDPLREQALLFGGWNGSFLNDTWRLDLKSLSWNELRPSPVLPSARRGASFVRDEEGKRIMMFGGCDGTTYLNELWKLDLENLSWELLSPSGTPPQGRELHGALVDPVRNRMVIHGGFDGTNFLDDTWILDLSLLAWHKLGHSNPPGRANHAFSCNSVDGSFVLFGGEGSSGFLGDLWIGRPEGDTITWEEKSQTLPYPGARTGHWGSYDLSTNSFLIFGGRDGIRLLNDLWSLNLSDFKWQQIVSTDPPPPERSGHRGVTISSGKELLIFGGWAGIYVNDLWLFNKENKSWTKIEAVGDIPDGFEFFSFAYDTLKDRAYLFGGFNGWMLGKGYMLYSFSPSPIPPYPVRGSKIGSR